jgi:hypothetical protein
MDVNRLLFGEAFSVLGCVGYFERAMQLSQDEYARYWRDMLLEEMGHEEEFMRARRLGMELVENAPD